MINSLLSFGAKSVKPEILEQTLTIREETVDEIEKNCINKVLKLSTWQSLTIAPRGSGKTHIIKVLYHRLKNNKQLSAKSVIAYMSEDEVGIANFTDLMVSILRAFIRYNEPGSDKLETQISEASLIKDINKREIFVKDILVKFADKRIIILLIENFDKILKSLGSQGQRSLRDFIHLYNNLSIIATSQNLIANLQDSKNPFYGFFNVYQLKKLDFEETVKFLKAIATTEGNIDLANDISKPEYQGKLMAIYELTEGNHRLLVTFYSFLKADFKSELSGIFIKVMNNLKPYYEQFVNALPAQQQKIVKHLSLNRRAISGKEIARACFIEPNVFSKQISLLNERGMIDKNKSGKDVFYELKEPLMRICFEISENPNGISSLFVDFLNAYYDRNIIREEYLKYKYGARFQNEEIKSKYRNEAIMYQMALSEPERETFAFSHKVFNEIENYSELENLIHSDDSNIFNEIEGVYKNFKKGNELVRQGQLKEAIKSYQKAIDINPKKDVTYYNMGYAFAELKLYEKAIKNYQKAIKVNAENDKAYYNMGNAFVKLKKYEEAIKSYQKAVELNPEKDDAYFNMGSAFIKLEKYKKAIENYQKAVDINSEKDKAYFNMGNAFADLKLYEEAIKSYQKAVDINPEDNEVYYNMGIAFENLKQYKDAIRCFKRSLELNPNDDETLFNIGITYGKLGEHKEALTCFKKAIELNSNDDMTYHNLGIAYGNIGKHDMALVSFQKAIELKPENDTVYLSMGIALANLKQYKDAIKYFQKAIKLNTKSDTAYFNMGSAQGNLGNHEEALESFKEVAKLKPNDDKAYFNIGKAFINLKEYDKAIKNFLQSIELESENVNTYNHLGIAYLKVGQINDAFETFHKGLEVKPDCMYTSFSLLGAYVRINDQNKSKELAKNIINKVDNDLLAYFLNEDVFYNLFRFGSGDFIKSYFVFLLRLLFKEKKDKQLWKALPESLFNVLTNIEDYENERLSNIRNSLSELLSEHEESIIPLKMFSVGISYLKSKEKNAIFKLSKEERKLFKEAILDIREKSE
jgi:tetratricopeptide (TPR) repeat protein